MGAAKETSDTRFKYTRSFDVIGLTTESRAQCLDRMLNRWTRRDWQLVEYQDKGLIGSTAQIGTNTPPGLWDKILWEYHELSKYLAPFIAIYRKHKAGQIFIKLLIIITISSLLYLAHKNEKFRAAQKVEKDRQYEMQRVSKVNISKKAARSL